MLGRKMRIEILVYDGDERKTREREKELNTTTHSSDTDGSGKRYLSQTT